MGLQVSTGFKDGVFGPQSFESLFYNGVINIYAGAQPARADDSIGAAVLVGEITPDTTPFVAGTSNGLRFARYRGIMTNTAPWHIRGIANGNASWARLCGNAVDAGGLSDTLPRIDMPVLQRVSGVAPTQFGIYLSNIAFTAAYADTLDIFYYTIPPV